MLRADQKVAGKLKSDRNQIDLSAQGGRKFGKESDDAYRPTALRSDAGEPEARVAAIGAMFDDLLDDRLEETGLLLEPALVLPQEAIKIMEKHPVKDCPLRMARAVDSRHIGNADSRNMIGAPEAS